MKSMKLKLWVSLAAFVWTMSLIPVGEAGAQTVGVGVQAGLLPSPSGALVTELFLSGQFSLATVLGVQSDSVRLEGQIRLYLPHHRSPLAIYGGLGAGIERTPLEVRPIVQGLLGVKLQLLAFYISGEVGLVSDFSRMALEPRVGLEMRF